MKPKLVFDLNKLKGSKTMEVYEGSVGKISKSICDRRDYMALDSGKGVYIKDPDGNEYLDFRASGCAANTGYCHPKVVEAIKRQAEKLTCHSFGIVTNSINNELAEKLIRITPGEHEKKVWFGCTGSDANDLIYRLVPEYKKRNWIITFAGSFHGTTMGACSLTGFRFPTPVRPCPGVIKAPFAYCYRCPFKLEYPKCGLLCADYLEEHIMGERNAYPPEDVAAIHLELIEGDSGIIVPPDDWVIRIKRICDKYDILFTVDEVRTGVGRTGKWFAANYFDHLGIVPDLIAIGKALTSGVPLSAVVGDPDILDFDRGSTGFALGGSPIPVEAANATIDVIDEEGLNGNAYKMGELIRGRFKELQKEYEIIGDVRGRGLFNGVELVRDRKTKEPASMETRKIVFRCWQLGLHIGKVGTYTNVLDVTPPLIITQEQVENGMDIVEQAMRDVLDGRVSDDTIAKLVSQ